MVDPINVNNAAPLIKTDNPTLGQRAEFFNLFNTVNYANPISNLNFATTDDNTGRVIDAGDFSRIISTSNNPRIVQFALKFNF